jgi:flagellar motor switch/type III secretory pathway protein FliN
MGKIKLTKELTFAQSPIGSRYFNDFKNDKNSEYKNLQSIRHSKASKKTLAGTDLFKQNTFGDEKEYIFESSIPNKEEGDKIAKDYDSRSNLVPFVLAGGNMYEESKASNNDIDYKRRKMSDAKKMIGNEKNRRKHRTPSPNIMRKVKELEDIMIRIYFVILERDEEAQNLLQLQSGDNLTNIILDKPVINKKKRQVASFVM